MVEFLPKKSVSRVYNAFLEFPLGDAYPKFRNKQEQELFNLTLELNTAKNLMIEKVLEEQKRIAALAQPESEVKDEVQSENNG